MKKFLKNQGLLSQITSPADEWRRVTRASFALDQMRDLAGPASILSEIEEQKRQLLNATDASGGRVFGALSAEAEQRSTLLSGAATSALAPGLVDAASSLHPAIAAATEYRRAYERVFRLPELYELMPLSIEAAQKSSLASLAFGAKGLATKLQLTMGKMTVPWLDDALPGASARAFADVQAIGALAARSDTFQPDVAALLREGLGDWRDTFLESDKGLLDPRVRADIYFERGLDRNLTDLPVGALDESLEVAGLPLDEQALFQGDAGEERADSLRAKRVYSIMRTFEIRLRGFIVEAMLAQFGQGWIKHQVPGDVRARWEQRKESDLAAGGGGKAHVMEFSDLGDCLAIIIRGDNWRGLFSFHFNSKESIKESLQRLLPIRNAIAHSRAVTEIDELYVRVETHRVMTAIRRSDLST